MADAGAPEPHVVQWIIDFLGGLVLMLGGAVVKALWSRQDKLAEAQDELKESLPSTYARRDDVKDGFAALERQHAVMNAKLDRLIERG